MRGSSFSLLLLLAGCAHPGIKIVYQDRPVPVIQHCLAPEDRPAQPGPLHNTQVLPQTDSALARALAKLAEWEMYGGEVKAVLDRCQA